MDAVGVEEATAANFIQIIRLKQSLEKLSNFEIIFSYFVCLGRV